MMGNLGMTEDDLFEDGPGVMEDHLEVMEDDIKCLRWIKTIQVTESKGF